jgi:tetratricopeptide (TPR) repeat protein
MACLVVPLADGFGREPVGVTDWDREIGRIGDAIAGLRSAAAPGPAAIEHSRFAHLLYRRAGLTGSAGDLAAAGDAIDRSIRVGDGSDDAYLLKASLDLRLHRVAAARSGLAMLSSRAGGTQVELLKADIALQEGRYDDARRGYEAVLAHARPWHALAQLAYLESRAGDPAVADRLYADAQEEMSAKEMRPYAWVELQRGLLRLRRGQHDDAGAHYQRARQAYSGDWLVDEHVAELLGSQGRFAAAAGAYERILARVPRPELQHALGDLYVFMGRRDLAAPWHDRALAAYLESAGRGEVHYYHHLSSFYADAREDGAAAVRWARLDAELRDNFATQEMLAWALYRDRQYTEALEQIAKPLAVGIVDAHLFFRAAMIFLAAGRSDDGAHLLRRAAEVNPRYTAFHVHR